MPREPRFWRGRQRKTRQFSGFQAVTCRLQTRLAGSLIFPDPFRPGSKLKSYPDQFEVFYDGDCPLCQREINWLRRRDRQRRIVFTDIADPGFDPESVGKSFQTLMDQIHGRTPDGRWITGVEVFRHLYHAAGFGKFVAVTRLPVIRHMLDTGYRVFARHRLRLTGRCRSGVCGVQPAADRISPHPASRQT